MRNARLRARLVSIAVCATLLAAACSRADNSAKSSTKSAPSTTGPSTTTARAAGPGDFGSIAGLCGPGDASGAPEGIAIGSPARLVRELKKWEAVGVDRVNFLLNALETVPQEKVLASLRLFAKEVMPQFEGASDTASAAAGGR